MRREAIKDDEAWKLEMELKLQAMEKQLRELKDKNTYIDAEGVKYITGYKQKGKISEFADC